MNTCHTLVVSDVHLGSRVCRGQKFLALLQNIKFNTLIINGDLFDSDDTKKFTRDHWAIISLLENIAKHHPVFLVGGNHGRKLDTLAKKMGITVKNDYAFSVSDTHFLCLHGDEFDLFVKHLPITSKLFTQLYYLIQRLGDKQQKMPMTIKKLSKELLGISRRQERLAIKRGNATNANVVICSHTHIPQVSKKDGILFINSGSFCETIPSYVTIDCNGKAELREM